VVRGHVGVPFVVECRRQEPVSANARKAGPMIMF